MANWFASRLFLLFLLFSLTDNAMAQDKERQAKEWAEQYVVLRHDAERGDVWAQGQLGYAYWLDDDFKNAFTWLKKAAEQGEASAEYRLGVMYQNGQATPQNYREAIVWYRRAAEQGHWGAQTFLAKMYRFGLGVTRDNLNAFMWQNIASMNGVGASVRDDIAKGMTSAQILQAQQKSQLCYSSNFKNCD